jgi:hypothetical protein
MIRVLLFVNFLVLSGANAQELREISQIPIDIPSTISIDRAGRIYLGDNKGNLNRYKPDGSFDLDYAPYRPSKITSIEAWQGLRIFLFYRDLQEYTFLNRFLVIQGEYSFNPDAIGFVEAATPTADNNVWIFDQTDFSLKKYDIALKEIKIHTPFDLLLDPDNYDIGTMKEYQNKLYISDLNTGILVFDNLGNYLSRIPYKGIDYFNFLDDELYFIRGHELIMINIYSKATRNVELPPDHPWLFPILLNDRYYLISEALMVIYER